MDLMNEELRRSLHSDAQAQETPDPHALLRAVTDEISTSRNRRARVWTAGAAAAAVVLGGLAVQQSLGDHQTSAPPADDPDTGSSSQWLLEDGAPPEHMAGLELVTTVEIDYGSARVTLPAPEDDGTGHVFAVAWCTLGPAIDSPAVQVPVASVSAGDEMVAVPCLGRDGEVLDGGPVPLPLGVGGFSLEVSGDLPREGSALVGLYREASWASYPLSSDDPLPVPLAPEGAVVIDSAAAPVRDDTLTSVHAWDRSFRQSQVTVGERTSAELWAGEPGQILVAVNGVVLTNDGETHYPNTRRQRPGPWQQADPALRAGFWTAWDRGERHTVDLSPAGLAAHGLSVEPGDHVTISVTAKNFPTEAWRVYLTGTGPEAVQSAPDLTGFPEWAHGFHRLSVTEIPPDGRWHTLDLQGRSLSELVWVIECDGRDPTEVRMAPDLQARTSDGASQADLTCVYPTPGWGNARQAVLDGHADAVELRVPDVGAGAGSLTVGLYEPVAWEDYPFEKSAGGLLEGWTGVEDGQVVEVLSSGPDITARLSGEVTSAELDHSGVAEVTVPSSQDLMVVVETDRPGRVRITVDGQPVGFEGLPDRFGTFVLAPHDGWFVNWSYHSAVWEVWQTSTGQFPVGQGERDHPTVRVEAEGYDDGGLSVRLFDLVRAQD